MRAAAGESARLVGVVGDEEIQVAAADWSSETLTPVLQLNRRGQLKFGWHAPIATDGGAGGSGEVKGKQSVRSVRVLRIKR